MVVILFRSKLTSTAGVDYKQTSDALESYVKSKPGFIAAKSFTAEDGERLTMVWWKDHETLEERRTDASHMAAQNTGSERRYEYYKMEVAEVFRESKFERASA